MAFLKFLRFKLRRISKRVVDDAARGTISNIPPQEHYGDPLQGKKKHPVRRFSWNEIEKLTMNFSRVIGEGGFSTVYLGRFPDSTFGAFKIHRASQRLNRFFKQELEILVQVRHDNIVKLLGYCDDREEGVLVFEYVPSGSLHEKLHDEQEVGEGESRRRYHLLPWKKRMSIAFQLAEAIEYLHDKCPLQIVHGDIKASNVLLDEQFNCKLCDFGYAKMGFSTTVVPSSSLSPLVMGSPGYIDPHYLRTGIPCKKNDVFSFGVIVLELITGIEAFCSEKEQLLTSIVGPIFKDTSRLMEIVDPRLAAAGDKDEAIAMAFLSARCICQQPSLRPSMSEILKIMRDNISFITKDFSK